MKDEIKDEYDVIIIGAGPAGLSCAIELQKSNKTVLIIEKNKEIGPKICAGGLSTKIRDQGISLDSADVLFYSAVFNVLDKAKKISMPKPLIATIDRYRLGKLLLEKISKKIQVQTGVEVSEIQENFIKINGQRKIRYKYLVGADGSNSIVRKFLGIKNKKFNVALQYIIPEKFKNIEIFFDASLFGTGYAWIFPHKNYTSIGCSSQNKKSIKPSELKNNFIKWLEYKKIDIKKYQIESGIINYDYQGFDFHNKFLAGDAGGFASGLTGEGIYFAIISGQEIGKKIVNPEHKCEKIFYILKIKYNHEQMLNLWSRLMFINKSLLNFYFKIVIFSLISDFFVKRRLKLYTDDC